MQGLRQQVAEVQAEVTNKQQESEAFANGAQLKCCLFGISA